MNAELNNRTIEHLNNERRSKLRIMNAELIMKNLELNIINILLESLNLKSLNFSNA